MTINFPKVRGERLIIAALAMILIVEAITTLCHLEKPGADGKFYFWVTLVDSLQSFGSFLLIVSLITTGIRKMRRSRSSFLGIAMLLIGLCLCAIPLLSVQMYKKIRKNIEELPKPHFDQMEAIMKKGDLPLDKRTKLSKMYAHDKYLYEGLTVNYLNDNGEEIRYIPTKEDIEFRNLNTTTIQSMKDISNRIPIITLTWITIPVISLLLGALTPIQKVTPNTRSDHDRA
jgi:hypothetical protein